MDINGIRLELRLTAMELLVSKSMAALSYQTAGSARGALAQLDRFAAESEKQMFPGFDPGMSDLISSEWAAAIGRLVDMQKHILEPLVR